MFLSEHFPPTEKMLARNCLKKNLCITYRIVLISNTRYYSRKSDERFVDPEGKKHNAALCFMETPA